MARMEMSNNYQAETAAVTGSADMFFELGLLYSSGRDRDTDLVSAHKWFNLAAMKGNGAARDYRMEISREMDSEDIAAAQRQAREWLRTH
jgi:hypothetical protein